MEMAKEKVKVKLINDEEVEVTIRKYITKPQKEEIAKRFTDRIQLRGDDNLWSVDYPGIINAFIEKLWSPEDNIGITLNDIVPGSIEVYIAPKVKDFLKMGAKQESSEPSTESSTQENAKT